MTTGPYGPGWPQASTVDDAYKALRFYCNELEKCLAHFPVGGPADEQYAKRADKAVTVMKVGFKILKKAAKKRRGVTRLSLVKG